MESVRQLEREGRIREMEMGRVERGLSIWKIKVVEDVRDTG